LSPESAPTVLTLSAVISNNAIHDSLKSVVPSCIQQSQDKTVFDSMKFSVDTLEDVAKIIKYKKHILRALFELQQVFKKAIHVIQEEVKETQTQSKEQSQWIRKF